MKELLFILSAMIISSVIFIQIIFSIVKMTNPNVCVYVDSKKVFYGNKAYIETKSLGSQSQVKIKSSMLVLDKMYTSENIIVSTKCD